MIRQPNDRFLTISSREFRRFYFFTPSSRLFNASSKKKKKIPLETIPARDDYQLPIFPRPRRQKKVWKLLLKGPPKSSLKTKWPKGLEGQLKKRCWVQWPPPKKKRENLLLLYISSVNTPERFQKSKPADHVMAAAPSRCEGESRNFTTQCRHRWSKLSSSIPKERPDEIFRWRFLRQLYLEMIVILIQATLSI